MADPKELSPEQVAYRLYSLAGWSSFDVTDPLFEQVRANARELEGLRENMGFVCDALAVSETKLEQLQSDVTELVTAIASGEPVTEAHRDLARAIQERWESEAKGG